MAAPGVTSLGERQAELAALAEELDRLRSGDEFAGADGTGADERRARLARRVVSTPSSLSIDRRRSLRLSCGLAIRMRSWTWTGPGLALDVSRTGLKIGTPLAPACGEPVEVELPPEDGSAEEPFRTRGTVVWATYGAAAGTRIGIAFLRDCAAADVATHRFVLELLRRSARE